jgi:DNA-directed RNA polymerase specialized sigma24 family protein
MKIPNNMTKQDVIDTITNVSRRLASKFTFAHYTEDDIAQEAFMIGMEALDRYDENRPLENFLFVHIRNRLKNFKRDNYIRYEQDKEFRYNQIKKSLAEPDNLDTVFDVQSKNSISDSVFIELVDNKEIFDLIDKHLAVPYRGDYLRMKNGVHVPKPRRDEIIVEIRNIFMEHGNEKG